MTSIQNVEFSFGSNISGDRAALITTRALELLRERLDSPNASWTRNTGAIAALEIESDSIDGMESEEAAQTIADTVYSHLEQAGRRNRG